MTERKIDELRRRAAAIGKRQADYHRILRPFAGKIARDFGEYVGDITAVTLTRSDGQVDASESHVMDHVGFEGGLYRIPIKVRIANLGDDDATWVRFRLYCALVEAEDIAVAIEGGPVCVVRNAATAELCERVFQHLRDRLTVQNFMGRHAGSYASQDIGFAPREHEGG